MELSKELMCKNMVKILKLGNISADFKLAAILWAVFKDTEKLRTTII